MSETPARASLGTCEPGAPRWRYLQLPLAAVRRIGPVGVTTSVALALAITGLALALGPITRGPAFHVYADQRTWLGLPHAGDVLTNLGFVVGGAWLLARMRGDRMMSRLVRVAPWAMIAIGLGSAAYHVAPGDGTLVTDWLPIGLTLACVVGAVAGDRLGPGAGMPAALTLAFAEVVAVASWYTTGGTDGGDLRGHVAVQVVGVLAPAVLVVARPGRIARGPILAALALFVLARLASLRDVALLDATGVSGHGVKHLLAAAAATAATAAIAELRGRGRG